MRTEIYIEQNRLDLTGEISTEFTYAIDDIKDFAYRNTSFSKTIVLPGNANNNKIFGHIFKNDSANEYNAGQPNVGFNFNPAKAAQCIILVDGIQIFKGILRLLEIIIDGGHIEYECAVFGELGGLVSNIGNKKLEDIDFGYANQVWNETTISNSWDSVSGGGVFYPLIDYGQVSYNSKHDWDFKAFRPALFVKAYMDKIITDSGYTYESSFFDTNFFKRLVIPNNQKTLTKSTTLGFNAEAKQLTYNTNANIDFNVISAGDFTDVNDNIFTYNSATPFVGDIELQISGTLNNIQSLSNLNFFLEKNGTPIKTVTYVSPGNSINILADLSVQNVTINQNDTLEVVIQADDDTGLDLYIDNGPFQIQSGTPSQVTLGYGDSIVINDTIPKGIFQRDFFASIIKMFNLYVTEDKLKEKHLIIEPYIDFYDVSGSRYDWGALVDRSKVLRFKPMSELTGRYYHYKYRQDSDFYNEQYQKKFSEGYADRIEDTGYTFASDTQSAEVIFSATPIVGYNGEDKVFSTIFKLSNTSGTQSEDKTEHNIRIMQAQKITGLTSWALKNGSGTTLASYTKYGYAGHLHFDSAEFPDLAPTSDINFGAPKEIYATYDGPYPSANLFNSYWSSYIAEIINKDSKLLNCNIFLKDTDIYNLDFAKLVYIDGSLWRINKIANYNPIDIQTTQVELLKVIELTY